MLLQIEVKRKMLGRSVTFGPKSVEKRFQQQNFFELTIPIVQKKYKEDFELVSRPEQCGKKVQWRKTIPHILQLQEHTQRPLITILMMDHAKENYCERSPRIEIF